MRDVTVQSSQASRKELREFGLVTGAIAAALFGLLLPWLFDHHFPLWPWIVAGILWAWGLLLPMSLRPVYRGWLAIGHVLGWLNTRIVLAVMFYAMFLPVGIAMRLLGKDPMARKFEQSKTTYRVTHAHPKDDHVERPY
jgi:hypothetical protein